MMLREQLNPGGDPKRKDVSGVLREKERLAPHEVERIILNISMLLLAGNTDSNKLIDSYTKLLEQRLGNITLFREITDILSTRNYDQFGSETYRHKMEIAQEQLRNFIDRHCR